jgi:hypothetical protein
MPLKPNPAFQQWFGESKVVDAKGWPLVVYHGAALGEDADIEQFYGTRQPGMRFTSSVGSFHGIGTFFSESPVVADSFPALRGMETTKRTYPVFVSVANPKRYKTLTQALTDFNDHHGGDPKSFVQALKKQGHDGVYFKEGPSWAGKRKGLQAGTWIPFAPEQIKSAYGNDGSFDAANPDIRFSLVDDQDEAIAEAPRP